MPFYSQSKKALGSETILAVDCPKIADALSVFDNLWTEVNSFEQRFSRFIDSSEITRVNLMAGVKTPVSTEFMELINLSAEINIKTDGLFNPLVLPALQKSGYLGSWPNTTKSHKATNFSARQVHGFSAIKIHKDSICLPKNSAIDFGGIGKGFLAEKLATKLRDSGIYNYWLSLGGDLVTSGYNELNRLWQIRISDYAGQDIRLAIQARDAEKLGVATSGTTKRRGPNWHHIINPTTGKPAKTDVLMATVVSNSALTSDVMAKCIVIVGSKNAAKFIKNQPEIITAVLQTANGQDKPLIYGEESLVVPS